MIALVKHPKVADIKVMAVHGPWQSKSGGELNVLLALSPKVLPDFFSQGSEQTEEPNIRGFRIYTVSDIPEGGIGAGEFHKVRQEMVFTLTGEVVWTSEDLTGETREDILDQTQGVWTPPYILHTYKVLQGPADLLVVANTLFFLGNKEYSDSYPADEFHQLQKGLMIGVLMEVRDSGSDLADFVRNMEAYNKAKNGLLRDYPGQWAAFYKGELAAVNADKGVLIREVRQKRGNVRAYIYRVVAELAQVKLPTPKRRFF